MKNKILYFLIALIFVISCKNKNDNTKDNLVDSNEIQNYLQIVKINNKVFSVPSPLQATMLIKEKNITFNQDLLNIPENHSKYLTSFKQSLNIGVYGANLGNLFLYDQLSQSAEYFNVIKKLAEQVGIMNSINEATLERIESNTENRDSLMYIISDIYREIDSYLLENDQEDLGALIITGGWIESIYLLTKIVSEKKDPEIISRIGEQKKPLANIIELLQPFYEIKSDEIDKLIEALINLSIIFDAIDENYIYEKPQTFPDKKLTIINSSTIYNISEEKLIQISTEIETLRNWIIE